MGKRLAFLDDMESHPTADARMRFYVTEKIGPTRYKTPEGFLVCVDVPIARTGSMQYLPEELGGQVEAGPDGLITISRDADEVFRPEYLASLRGKSIVDDHPDEDVQPHNYKSLSCGVLLDPRRGVGEQADLLVADLMIMDQDAIRAVEEDDKIEVSCGYDADYEALELGKGRQYNMIGNHLAIVRAGRCGPRCAIGDRKTVFTSGDDMKTRDHKAVTRPVLKKSLDALRTAIKAKDEAGMTAALEATEAAAQDADIDTGGDTHVHIHAGQGGSGAPSGPLLGGDRTGAMGSVNDDDPTEARFKKLEDGVAKITDSLGKMMDKMGMGDGDPDKDKIKDAEKEKEDDVVAESSTKDRAIAVKARDSALMEDSFQETIAMAEVLSPGVRFPTFTRDAAPVKTLDALCKFRRTTLDLAYATPEGRGVIDEIAGDKFNLDGMSCGAVRTLFRSAAVAMKAANSASARTGDAGGHRGAQHQEDENFGPRSIAEINALNAKHYSTVQH